MGLLSPEDTNAFSRGILIGLIPMPAAQILGGLAGGMQFLHLLKETIPILLFSAALMLCLHFAPQKSLKVFGGFAKFLQALSLIGLTLGAVQYIGNIKLLPSLMPLEEAMQVVASIGIVMLGSLPAAELLRHGLSRPFSALGRKLHMDDRSFAALLVGFVSATPAISMIKGMDLRGKVMNAAFLVCGASALASHLGFTVAVERSLIFPLLITKLTGGLMGAALALLLTRQSAGNSPVS